MSLTKSIRQSKNRVIPIFQQGTQEVEIKKFSGFNSRDTDTDVEDGELTGGQNVRVTQVGEVDTRPGMTLYGNTIGTVTGILGGFNFVDNAGTQEKLVVYDTGVYRDVAGVWTALTSVTMTTNLKADGVYFPITDKFYIINGTDNVVKYTSGAGGDQTDADFKKGLYIEHFKNRLLVAVDDVIWYTDLGVDTFSANNYYRLGGKATGIITYYDKVLHFTKNKIYRLQNFTFDGVAAGPESLIELPVQFGAIYDRTIVLCDNFIYFLGQDSDNKCHIYKTDGYKAVIVSDKIAPTLDGLAAGQLQYACAGFDGRYYRLSVAESGQTSNNIDILFDTIRNVFLPPDRRISVGKADFSCYFNSESLGQWDLYAGTQSRGQVYKLNQGTYDELPEEEYLTLGTYDVPINANPSARGAQSFKLSNYNSTQTIATISALLRLKKVSGTTTELTVRLETDNNGKPSGTLADPDAIETIAAFSTTDYNWKKVTFTDVNLSGNTTYWLICKHTTEDTGDSKYAWSGDTCSATYANGMLSTYNTAVAGTETFSPDADPETASVDGYAIRGGASLSEAFSTIRAGDGLYAYDSSAGIVCYVATTGTTDRYLGLTRGYVLFNTASLPNDAIITSAVLSLYSYEKNTTISQSIGITAGTPASNTAIVAADYAIANFGSTEFATRKSISDITLNAYNDFTLNASGLAAIDKTGVTKFALRLSCDIDNTAPTWASWSTGSVSFRSAEHTYKPRLTITYTTATGSKIWNSDATTDQNFMIYIQSAIDSYADFKALTPAGIGKDVKLHKAMALFQLAGTENYNVEVGFDMGRGLRNYLISLNPPDDTTWGGGSTWGGGTVWGNVAAKNYVWWSLTGAQGRTIKPRIRNRNVNQPFSFQGVRMAYSIKHRQI